MSKRSRKLRQDTGSVEEALRPRAPDVLLDAVPDGICQLDARGSIVFANQACHGLLGHEQGALLGRQITDVIELAADCKLPFVSGRPAATGTHSCFGTAARADGSKIEVRIDWRRIEPGTRKHEAFACVLSDVTGQLEARDSLEWQLAVSAALAELSAALVSSAITLEDVANIVLERARSLTRSAHGYVASIDLSTGDLIAHTLTSMMEAECRVPGKSIIFPRGPDGRYPSLWGHCLNTKQAFYSNEPAVHGASGGIPAGHIEIHNFLAAPALIGETVVGQIAVANSKTPYGNRDLETIRRLAQLYALFINRVQMEQHAAMLARLPSESPHPVLRLGPDGSVLYANRAASALLDQWCTPKGKVSEPWLYQLESVLSVGTSLQTEERIGDRYFAVTYVPVQKEQYVNVYALDTTEQRMIADFLRRERDFSAAVLDTAAALVVVVDTDGGVVQVNRACEELTGYRLEDFSGKPAWEVLSAPEEAPEASRVFEEVRSGLFPIAVEYHILTRTGARRLIAWRYTALLGRDGLVEFVIATGLDISESRHFQMYQALVNELLEHLNRPQSGLSALAEVTGTIKEFTGLEAIGVRLREGDDFPYFVTVGFPPRFVEAENHLCATAPDGSLLRDSDGNPVLECMCGNVIYGRTDSSKSFFTEGGSFWTNSTTALLASTTDEDRGTHTRNTCNTQGYESVALVPIRADEEIVGLLQLNDRRKNRFTPLMILFMERIGATIGMAIKRQRAEEALRELNETLEARVADRTAALENRARLLRKLASELTHAENRERRRLAVVLHDHLQQILVAAKLKVDMLDHGRANGGRKQALREASQMLQQAIDSSRSLAVELSPPILYEAGLAPAVEWLGRQMHEKHGLEVDLQVDESVTASEETGVLIFHALREALFNIVKHARVRRAAVRMSARSADRLMITVTDAGVGFQTTPLAEVRGEPRGLGLLSIRERLEAVGGSLKVESTPGEGTQVTMTVPTGTQEK